MPINIMKIKNFVGIKLAFFGVVLIFIAYLIPNISDINIRGIMFILGLSLMCIGSIIHFREHFSHNAEIKYRESIKSKQPWD